jgi:hypothetical protein
MSIEPPLQEEVSVREGGGKKVGGRTGRTTTKLTVAMRINTVKPVAACQRKHVVSGGGSQPNVFTQDGEEPEKGASQ